MIIDILKKFINNDSLISIEKRGYEEKLCNAYFMTLFTIDSFLRTNYSWSRREDEDIDKKNFLFLLRNYPDELIESRTRRLEKIKKEISKDLENVSGEALDDINYCCKQIDIVIEMFNIYKNKFVKE